MINTHLEARKERFHALSSRLAHIDSKQLNSLLGDTGPARGWGATHTIKMGSSKIFVKRVPLTELEYDNMFSTENLYGLPIFYNYGVGSAGFGAFRELVAHIKTTNWVLGGSCVNFPLMYHYRIVPFSGKHADLDPEKHNGYVKYWNGDENIDRYIRARSAAKYEIILFLEYFPHVLGSWLAKNLDKSETVIREMRQTVAFLREHGIIHFDAHFHNIVLDGGIPYLTDFGLVLDKSFALDAGEQEFFRRHIDYDDAEFLVCLGGYLHSVYENLSAGAKKKVRHRYGIGEDTDHTVRLTFLLDNIEELNAGGLIKLGEHYAAELAANRGLIKMMRKFYSGMQGSDRKDTRYEHTKIRRLLNQAKHKKL